MIVLVFFGTDSGGIHPSMWGQVRSHCPCGDRCEARNLNVNHRQQRSKAEDGDDYIAYFWTERLASPK
jgi:hypothetical protein